MEHKELRDKILAVLDENDGDLHLQADGLIAMLREEGLLTDEDLDELFDDEEESEDEW